MKEKLTTLIKDLNKGLVQRDDIIKTSLLTAIAGENCLLVGPPGTGKSLVSRRIADAIAFESDSGGDNYFEYLLTKFSTPEEIFGPLSISELKADRFVRKTAGYLPNVKVAFLDEIFKANSSVLNSLLSILNERIYHNGLKPQKVPLQVLIAASNELPTNQEELSALYDRFLVRSFVDYVSENNIKSLLTLDEPFSLSERITESELLGIREGATQVTASSTIIDVVTSIWREHKEVFKEDNRENISDRRLMKVMELLRVSAQTNGRNEVDFSDVLLLKNCLWNHQDNAEKVHEIIIKVLKNQHLKNPISVKTLNNLIEPSNLQQEVGKVIKGLKGSGTSSAPLLIEKLQDLYRLNQPEIGQHGFYFKQTTDIDCNNIESWLSFDFKGTYDGNGYKVIFSKEVSCEDEDKFSFINTIEPDSKVLNLHIEKLPLAGNIEGSKVIHCSSDRVLIVSTAKGSTVKHSSSYNRLVSSAENCIISDCLVTAKHYPGRDYGLFGLFSYSISNNTTIERCFIAGEFIASNRRKASGFARSCNDSKIIDCAIGRLKDLDDRLHLRDRIVTDITGNSTIKNNVSIVSNEVCGSDELHDGKSIPESIFAQALFESTLDWDFDTIWQWDESKDQPKLRFEQFTSQINTPNSTDILTQQINDNIWL